MDLIAWGQGGSDRQADLIAWCEGGSDRQADLIAQDWLVLVVRNIMRKVVLIVRNIVRKVALIRSHSDRYA